MFLTHSDSSFPLQLKQVRPKVESIFYKGNLNPGPFENCVSVVGSRRITNYGRQVLEKIIPPLVDAGITIVSGFMYGVDQEAHKIVLENKGMTIAVLGWGIDWPVPEDDQKLYLEIENKGLIVSEYEGQTKAQLWMFPRRNRIVAGLSKATIVIEAAEKSGSLITADYALKFGKKLFAVPGPITSRVSEGCNQLIKDGKAKMLTCAEDILSALNIKHSIVPSGSHPEGGEIMKLLSNEALTVDELARIIKKPVESLAIELSMLQLTGDIVERDGKYYIVDK
ncbi:MAG: DNA-processing protein DprA [Patescibacteria group bacterium]